MEKKIAGLLGAVAALGTMGAAQAAPAPIPTDALQANSYADLLQPIANASVLLQALDEQQPAASTDGNIRLAQYHHHHHHHHHHHAYRPRIIVRCPTGIIIIITTTTITTITTDPRISTGGAGAMAPAPLGCLKLKLAVATLSMSSWRKPGPITTNVRGERSWSRCPAYNNGLWLWVRRSPGRRRKHHTCCPPLMWISAPLTYELVSVHST